MIEVESGRVNGDTEGSIQLVEMSRLTVRGGTVRGNILAAGSASVDVIAGTLIGDGAAVQLDESVVATIRGGDFMQNPSTSGPLIVTDGTSSLDLSGGSFEYGIRASGMSTIDVHGGLYPVLTGAPTFEAIDEAVINVYGFDLSINNDTLTGRLEDGSVMNHHIGLMGNGRVAVFEVPEPAGLPSAFIAGILCWWRRRAPQTNSMH